MVRLDTIEMNCIKSDRKKIHATVIVVKLFKNKVEHEVFCIFAHRNNNFGRKNTR